MRKDNLKKLFNYVNENEKSSVEFQAVWRKVHRTRWKKRILQSAVHNIAIFITILILTPIVGNYVLTQKPLSNSSQYSSDHISKIDYNISGKVYNFPNQIVIKGQSNLPKGTIISLEQLEKEGEFISEDRVSTSENGSFQFTTDRLDRSKEYIVKVSVYSHIQKQDIKAMLGDKGENLRNSGYLYQQNGKSFYGLKLLGLANKIDDTNEYVLSTFLQSPKEFDTTY
jgi:hypothetical protein